MDSQPVVVSSTTNQPPTSSAPTTNSTTPVVDMVTLPGGVKMPKTYAYGLGILGIFLLLR